MYRKHSNNLANWEDVVCRRRLLGSRPISLLLRASPRALKHQPCTFDIPQARETGLEQRFPSCFLINSASVFGISECRGTGARLPVRGLK